MQAKKLQKKHAPCSKMLCFGRNAPIFDKKEIRRLSTLFSASHIKIKKNL
jgi:hypothetical protein